MDNPSGIDTHNKEPQASKDNSFNKLNPFGKDITDSALHPVKAETPIEVSPLGKHIEYSELHPSNVYPPIEVTQLGIETYFNAPQYLNATEPKVILEPMFTSVTQLRYALSGLKDDLYPP